MATVKGIRRIFGDRELKFCLELRINTRYHTCGCQANRSLLSIRPNRTKSAFAVGSIHGLFSAQTSRSIHTTSSYLANKKDFYDVLGVSKKASQKDIKKAYYKLAKQYHPDVNKDDASSAKKFQEVSEAYEILGDDTKRQQYDTFGTAGNNMGGAGGFNQAGGFGQGGGFQGGFHAKMDPEELFRQIFGDGFGKGGFQTGNFEDFSESNFGFAPASEVILNLTFQEAARGVNKNINLNVKDTCPKCQGSRAEPGTKPVRCPYCNGTGMETIRTGSYFMHTTCTRCYGTRVHIKYPCSGCAGKGQTLMRKTVMVPVPAGVEDGQSIRVTVGRKEVFVVLRVAKSSTFRREGADIHSDVGISLAQAVLGGSLRIPGLYDDILLQIPAGTQSHTRIRLAGKGVSKVNSYGYGDHYVHIKIKVPIKLDQKQKALLLAYAESEKGIQGTVTGVTNTDSGKFTIDDPDGLVAQIRTILNYEKTLPADEPIKENESEDGPISEEEKSLPADEPINDNESEDGPIGAEDKTLPADEPINENESEVGSIGEKEKIKG
ncbi:protein tumorous imaginal discs, mitochondrial-like [Lineus longissimus]|uniref:protein tumorous imaginal discs, mitochondrial-like n=1 Tax=Lineus longissimus TaxID=88925 RepID=UPI002B4C6062